MNAYEILGDFLKKEYEVELEKQIRSKPSAQANQKAKAKWKFETAKTRFRGGPFPVGLGRKRISKLG